MVFIQWVKNTLFKKIEEPVHSIVISARCGSFLAQKSMAKVIESGPEQLVHQNSVLLYPSTKDHKIRCTNIQNNTYLFILSATIIVHCRIVAGCYITPPFQKVCPHTSDLKFRIRATEANNCSVSIRWPP